METPKEALDLIKSFEGCKLKAYRCPAGVWTIGWGATGPGIVADTVWTQKEADDAFEDHIEKFELGVKDMITVPVTANQFGALVSLAYNIGIGRLRKSSVIRKLNAGDYQGAADSFLTHCKARIDGTLQILKGLVRRRKAERELFLKQ